MLVGRFRLRQLAGDGIDVVVALARAVDAVGPVQAGVEPLRRVRRGHLRGQHVAQLVEEGARIVFGVEIAALPAPIGPGAGETVEHLLGRCLADRTAPSRAALQAPSSSATERHRNEGTVVLFDLLQARGHAGLAEIFLRQHVGSDLRPEVRHLDILELEHDRAVRIADLAGGEAELDARIGRLSVLGVAPFNSHVSLAPKYRTVGTALCF